MAIFRRMTQNEIETHFTHYARFCGIVPCYLNMDDGWAVIESNWVPEWCFWLVAGFYANFVYLVSLVNDDFEPGWSFVITGEIKKKT